MGRDDIERALSSAGNVALDSMVFIYHFEDHPEYAPLTQVLFDLLADDKVTAVGSVLCLTEALTEPARQGEATIVHQYRLAFALCPNLSLLPISTEIATEAAIIRARTRMATPDAIHVATAQLGGARVIVTNDKRLAAGSTVPCLLLADFL